MHPGYFLRLPDLRGSLPGLSKTALSTSGSCWTGITSSKLSSSSALVPLNADFKFKARFFRIDLQNNLVLLCVFLCFC